MKTISSSTSQASSRREGENSQQSHALWRYIDDLYGPLNREMDTTILRNLINRPAKTSTSISRLGPISIWRDRYGLVNNIDEFPSNQSVLVSLKESRKELEAQMRNTSSIASSLLKTVQKRVSEKAFQKLEKDKSRQLEETYMCRRLAKWNIQKFEIEVKAIEESSDPRCHQCHRATSELKDGNVMISCTQPIASMRCVRETYCGLPSVCTKRFCTHCLDKVYQMKLNSTQKKWKCPHCRGGCFNFRCLRETRLDILRPRFYDTFSLSKTQRDTLKRATLVLKRNGSVVGICGVCMKIEPLDENTNLIQCSGIGCRTFVHSKCARSMSSTRITNKVWLCEVCIKGEDTERLACPLCPNNHVPTYYYRKPGKSTTAFRESSSLLNDRMLPSDVPLKSSSSSSLMSPDRRPRRYGVPLLGIPAFTWDNSEKRWVHVVCKRWTEYNDEEEEEEKEETGKESTKRKTRTMMRKIESDIDSTDKCLCKRESTSMITVRCMHPHCNQRFHPICGLVARPQLYVRQDVSEDGTSRENFIAMCEKHHPLRSMSHEKTQLLFGVLRKQLDDARNIVSIVLRREKQKRNLIHFNLPLWIKECEESGVIDEKETERMLRVLLRDGPSSSNRNDKSGEMKQSNSKSNTKKTKHLSSTRYWPTRNRVTTMMFNHPSSNHNDGKHRFSKNSNTFKEPPPYRNFLDDSMYFRLTQSIETAAKLSSQISGVALRLSQSDAEQAEEGSVEYILSRQVILWNRTRACFASKASSSPKMYDLIRHLLSKPEWTLYVWKVFFFLCVCVYVCMCETLSYSPYFYICIYSQLTFFESPFIHQICWSSSFD